MTDSQYWAPNDTESSGLHSRRTEGQDFAAVLEYGWWLNRSGYRHSRISLSYSDYRVSLRSLPLSPRQPAERGLSPWYQRYICERILADLGKVAMRNARSNMVETQDLYASLCEGETLWGLFKQLRGESRSADGDQDHKLKRRDIQSRKPWKPMSLQTWHMSISCPHRRRLQANRALLAPSRFSELPVLRHIALA